MGGQSTEPVLFLSDKNVLAATNEGGEKGSDAKQDGRGLLNTDPTALTIHSPRASIKTLTCRFANSILEIYSSKRRNVVGTYVNGDVAGLRMWER